MPASLTAPLPLVVAFDKALAAYLRLDPDSARRLEKLDGKLLALELLGTGMTLYLLGEGSKLSVRAVADEAPDATISATPIAFAELAIKNNADKAMFAGQLKISGDTEAGQALQDILKGVDIDWEELLSGFVGDVAAHQLGRGMRGLLNWGRNSKAAIEADIGELLLHEMRLLPMRESVEQFLADVDTLRSDIERFAVRLDRAEQRFNQ